MSGTHEAPTIEAVVILNALRPDNTAKPRELFDDYFSHLRSHHSDFFLSTVTQAGMEEIEERPKVHANDNL
jgi:hypothetical protein